MRFLSKLIRKHNRTKEAFQTRLQMETMAQDHIRARLDALDLTVKNQTRKR